MDNFLREIFRKMLYISSYVIQEICTWDGEKVFSKKIFPSCSKKKKKIDGSFDRIDQASSKFQISVFIRIIYNNRSETKNNVIIIIDDRYYEKSRGKRSGGRRRRGGEREIRESRF